MFHVLWTILSGRLLMSRGAIIPALADSGLAPDAVRRAWAALAHGSWRIEELLHAWEQLVNAEACWQPHQYGGYSPVAADLAGFFRPRLRPCPTKHYSPQAGRALPAIPFGLLVSIGSVHQQRLPLPRAFVRADPHHPGDTDLQMRLLQLASTTLAPHEALVLDRGFPIQQVQTAGVPRFVARGPRNFTARRATLPAYRGRGRKPTRGQIVRPLARQRKGKPIAATPPDRTESWTQDGKHLRAEFWEHLVSSTAGPAAPTFTCVVIHDPDYREPLLLTTNLLLTGQHLRAFYLDRWPVEQLPLVAKQMLGAHRQFVFAEEARQRLPELALLAGAVLSYVAATQEAIPTGFWDREPRPTAGRLRRSLARIDFSKDLPLPEQLRKKQSLTAHLPRGVAADRRQKSPLSTLLVT